tara:strand:+ start:832 stop:1242 length:411 start_codon:yes stop_codon:yes gene_type:complete
MLTNHNAQKAVMFIRFIAAISRINFSDFYQCFGLKGLAIWLVSFIFGFAMFESIWPKGTLVWIILFIMLFYFTAKVRYISQQDSLSSEQIWELKKTAREDAERKAIDEGRAIVPKHGEIKSPVQVEKVVTPLRLKK